jgi:solute carrier family 25 carnitine/acylcarnitine transporter 20/29
MNGLVFAAYRGLMRVQLEDEKDIPTLTQVAIAGTGTGIIGSYVSTTFQYVAVLMFRTPQSARNSSRAAQDSTADGGGDELYGCT